MSIRRMVSQLGNCRRRSDGLLDRLRRHEAMRAGFGQQKLDHLAKVVFFG